MNYLVHLVQSKGLGQLGQRTLTVGRRYGLRPRKMLQALDQIVKALEQRGCQATFPITAVALSRHPAPIRVLQERGMELAVHGWTHVDLERCSMEKKREHLSRALDVFAEQGISVKGFRSPYLRCNGVIREVAGAAGFRYVSNQPILWDVVGDLTQSRGGPQTYHRAVDFYAPWLSAARLSLPTVCGRIVEIPVSLPDDEMLVERLGANSVQIAQIWAEILRETYAKEELFTVQIHPERAAICTPALEGILSRAHSCSPPVWIARLDQIAEWWQQRLTLRVDVTQEQRGQYRVVIWGPMQARALVRSAQVIGESERWGGGYRLVRARCFSVRCGSRPLIGVSRRSCESLVVLLKRLGYLFEVSEKRAEYAIYLDRPSFSSAEERPLCQEIEMSGSPLVRISRWPGGARSALAITGDIDALTLWDYGLRTLGR